MHQPVFASFLQGGFECSTHVRPDGRRLDLVSATKHDQFATQDFNAVKRYGMRTVREGLRWHIIERLRDNYDFTSALAIHRAAENTNTEVIWDLLHFGWPDHQDVFSPAFPESFGRFAGEFARILKSESNKTLFLAPVNEISFLSWGGGEKGFLNPFARGRGCELKRQLVRSYIAAVEAIGCLTTNVRFVAPEPVIHIASNPALPEAAVETEHSRRSMFEAWDMICGRLCPELGGKPGYLDIIGINFYDRNQWVHFGPTLTRCDPDYRPFREILKEIHDRYQRPLFVAETGTEDDGRSGWFNYVANEVVAAMRLGVPMKGLCLYPIVNHPGWNDDRHCRNGLFDYAGDQGYRSVHKPLARALLKANVIFQVEFQNLYEQYDSHVYGQARPPLPIPPALEFRFPAATASYEPVRTGAQGILF